MAINDHKVKIKYKIITNYVTSYMFVMEYAEEMGKILPIFMEIDKFEYFWNKNVQFYTKIAPE